MGREGGQRLRRLALGQATGALLFFEIFLEESQIDCSSLSSLRSPSSFHRCRAFIASPVSFQQADSPRRSRSPKAATSAPAWGAGSWGGGWGGGGWGGGWEGGRGR